MAATLTSLSASLSIGFTASVGKSLDLSNPVDALAYSFEQSFTFGTGILECDALWHDEIDIGGVANVDIDLAGAAVYLDAFGDAPNFAEVKVMIIENLSTSASALTVGGAAATQFDTWLARGAGAAADIINLEPGESKVLISRVDAAGYVSTGAADDLLRVTNILGAGNACKFKIIVMGESA